MLEGEKKVRSKTSDKMYKCYFVLYGGRPRLESKKKNAFALRKEKKEKSTRMKFREKKQCERKIKVFCGTKIFMRMSSYKTVKFE